MTTWWDDQRREPRIWESQWTWAALATLPVGAVFALLAGREIWWIALVLLLILPGFLILHRRPFLALTIWVVVAPFIVTVEAGGLGRKGYWLIHRALPVIALAVVVIGGRIGVHRRRLHRLGFPELLMAGYLAASLISVWYTSLDPLANTYRVYDWIFIPMCFYIMVRLLRPDEEDLRRLMPALVFLVVSQALFGILQWVEPGLLPEPWLNKLGQRTTGSLQHPNAYAVTMLFAGVLLLNAGGTLRRIPRWMGVSVFVLGALMVAGTFSRAAWLAGIVVVLALLMSQRSLAVRILAVTVPVLVILAMTGVLAAVTDQAESRISSAESEQSALSRLPVVLASVRMIEQRPVFGWGYENFDRFDRQFQGSVGDLVVPDRDHASHNVYLTILAEQGLVGFALYISPAVWWLALTPSAARHMPRKGFFSRRLLFSLWLVVIAFVIVSNFANMRVVFTVTLWWIILGLIGSIVSRYRPSKDWRGRETSPEQRPFRDVLMEKTGMRGGAASPDESELP